MKRLLGISLAVAMLALVGANTARATAITSGSLLNGSFETITANVYVGDARQMAEAASWINLSIPGYYASSSLSPIGANIPGPTQGLRELALWAGSGNKPGLIVQQLGTIQSGQTYDFIADGLSGDSGGSGWGAIASFVSYTTPPAYLVWTQPNNGTFATVNTGYYPNPGTHLNVLHLTYTATALDAGKELYILLQAMQSAPTDETRGAIDNARFTATGGGNPVPEPGTWLLLSGSLIGLCVGGFKRFVRK